MKVVSDSQEKQNGDSFTHCHPMALLLPPMVTSPLFAEITVDFVPVEEGCYDVRVKLSS
jgi:hypothetical protein